MAEQEIETAAPADAGTAPDELVRAVAVWNVFQFQAAEIARRRAQRAGVKAFAELLWQDHAEFTEALLGAAGTIIVPTSVDKLHEAFLDDLRNVDDDDFDALYLKLAADAVAKAYELLRDYVQTGEDGPLRDFCGATLLRVARHGDALAAFDATDSATPRPDQR